MAIRLVATDLDGTLLGPDGRLSARTVAAIRAAHEAGITVVAATGRSHHTALARVAAAEAVRYVICSNGASLYDRHAGAVVSHHPIAERSLPQLVDVLRRELGGTCFGWEQPDGFGWESDFVHMRPEVEGTPASVVPRFIAPWPDYVSKVFVGHRDLHRDHLLAAVTPHLVDGLVATCSGARFVEVTGAGVDKAFGVARLCAELGIAPDEVLAIGDHLNDVAMLRWAGRGVAMGGAHPAVLAAAGEQAPGCADDGVACVLESLLA
jgi:hydroxymethylpyrimidine pyrophosphatase-like HAD family hydrolase